MSAELVELDAAASVALRRAPGALSASTDAEAASVWLAARASRSTDTFDAYRREATKLLLWLGERKLTLRQMTVEHVHKFYEHLAKPPKHWIRPRKAKANQRLLATQVLAKPLAPSSIAYARRVLAQLASFLQDAGYLQFNVFKLSTKPAVVMRSAADRSLDVTSWCWLRDWTVRLPRRTAREMETAARGRWLLALLYHTGIRRMEAANGTMGDFVRRDDAWELRVVGKGLKERYIAVNSVLLDELRVYRTELSLPVYPSPSETRPLVGSVLRRKGTGQMTPRSVGLVVHDLSRRAASECEDEQVRRRIEAMSTHWMRHTSATHRLLAGASIKTTQDEFGHADPKTTGIYTHTDSSQRHADAEKLAVLARR